jgi:hypothetical protein
MSFAPDFERFWTVWPKNGGRYSRKGGKAACLSVWNKRYHFTQADQIIKHVEWLKTTEAWLKDQGAYIPAPLVYLNQQRWDGADIPEPPKEQPAIEASNDWLRRQEEQTARVAQNNEAKVKEALDRMARVRAAARKL